MIELKELYKSYKNKSVLININLTIHNDEFFVLIGSSGCGKTTLLKTINKLNAVDRGKILIDGKNVRSIPISSLPKRIGYVVQEGGLFPHMTVWENIAVTMKLAGMKKEEIEPRSREMMNMVSLDPDTYGDLYPSQLSGGQRQRVGIARAFAPNPPIILMDEPFSALDPVTRNELQDEVYRLQKDLHKTIVFVTHDMDEAIKLANRICIIRNGHVVQCDSPEKILKDPANSYVEEFIGKNKLWSNPEFINAGDIMLERPVISQGSRTVVQAIHIMSHFNVDSLLITGGGKLEGIVWLNDLQKIKNRNDKVENFISNDYISVFTDTTLKKIISTIDYEKSGIIPVLDHDGTLQGFLTRGRLLSTLSRQFIPDGSVQERSGLIE